MRLGRLGLCRLVGEGRLLRFRVEGTLTTDEHGLLFLGCKLYSLA